MGSRHTVFPFKHMSVQEICREMVHEQKKKEGNVRKAATLSCFSRVSHLGKKRDSMVKEQFAAFCSS